MRRAAGAKLVGRGDYDKCATLVLQLLNKVAAGGVRATRDSRGGARQTAPCARERCSMNGVWQVRVARRSRAPAHC